MKHPVFLISSVLLISTCLSCDIRWRSGDYVYNPEIVVDGWIEEGEAANVILTQTVMVNPDIEQGEIKLQDIPIKWAKVTVSDGEQTVKFAPSGQLKTGGNGVSLPLKTILVWSSEETADDPAKGQYLMWSATSSTSTPRIAKASKEAGHMIRCVRDK